MLLQQLLRVMNAGAGGRMCGKVELSSVVDPFQGLRKKRGPMMSGGVHTTGMWATQFTSVRAEALPTLITTMKLQPGAVYIIKLVLAVISLL